LFVFHFVPGKHVPTDIQDSVSLPKKDSNYSHQGRRRFFTITTPSDEDFEKLLDARKDNT
jgi:hypothetical protein